MICNALNCEKEATLYCPTCQKKGIEKSLSAFCSQVCFKASWKEHKYTHIVEPPLPTGSYTYALIPADPSVSLAEMTGDLSRGLESDEVQAVARLHFFGPEENPRAFQMVDICTILVPSSYNGYIGISLYSSGDSARPVNGRATELTQACGHTKTVIYGDAYVSRCYDNEAEPWVRRDLLVEEVNVEAPWVRQATLLNHGRNMDAYTSGGAAEKAMHQLVKGKGMESGPAVVAAAATAGDDDWTSGTPASNSQKKNYRKKK